MKTNYPDNLSELILFFQKLYFCAWYPQIPFLNIPFLNIPYPIIQLSNIFKGSHVCFGYWNCTMMQHFLSILLVTSPFVNLDLTWRTRKSISSASVSSLITFFWRTMKLMLCLKMKINFKANIGGYVNLIFITFCYQLSFITSRLARSTTVSYPRIQKTPSSLW